MNSETTRKKKRIIIWEKRKISLCALRNKTTQKVTPLVENPILAKFIKKRFENGEKKMSIKSLGELSNRNLPPFQSVVKLNHFSPPEKFYSSSKNTRNSSKRESFNLGNSKEKTKHKHKKKIVLRGKLKG